MSMVKALAKAAIGIAVAKGVSGMMAGGGARRSGSSGGMADILTSAMGGSSRSGGGLADLLGGAMGGGASRGAPSGGLADILTGAMGAGAGASGAGGIADMLGKMMSGDGPRGRGSLGGALEELSRISTGSLGSPEGATGLRGRDARFDAPSGGSFGDMLNRSLDSFGQEPATPTAAQEALAGLLLRALIQAAKADGQIDAGEKKMLGEHLGDLDRSEIDFINAELAKPVDVVGLARETPKADAAQVYMMSVMAIDLDTKQEAQYLHDLTQALGISAATANQIHDRLGEPRIFR